MNPWTKLKAGGSDYVLPEDLPYIEAFNARLREQHSDYEIETGRIPEPRQGPVRAPVVLLQLNPRFDDSDVGRALTPEEVNRTIDNLQNEESPHSCIANGVGWWGQSFNQLSTEVGPNRLSRRVCSIEFFPYFSCRFGHAELRLPSQAYTFDLVHGALDRNALILITRGLNTWLGSVPELLSNLGRTVFETKNPRRAFISKGNLPEGVYAQVLERVR